MNKLFNIKNGKICAFCKYWYDPTNSYISPQNTTAGFWNFESSAKCSCTKRNFKNVQATFSCSDYKCKVI